MFYQNLEDLVFSEARKNHQKAIDQYLYMANLFVATTKKNKYNEDLSFKRDGLSEANKRLCFKEVKN